jgi:hypothetical protein
MPNVSVLRGKASHTPDFAAWFGATDALPALRETDFRVDNQPVVFSGTPALVDGDKLTLAGHATSRGFRAFALRNHSTGAEYLAPTGRVAAAFLALLGLVLIAVSAPSLRSENEFVTSLSLLVSLAGLACGCFGVSLFVSSRRNRRANSAMLAACGFEPASSRAPDGRNLSASIVGGLFGSLGVVLIGAALLLVLGVIIPGLSTLGRIGLASSGALLGFFGVRLLRWGLKNGLRRVAVRTEPPSVLPDHLATVRRRLLAIARRHGGRVTAAEVAAELEFELPPAQRVLEETAEAGGARLLLSPDGVPVYEFQELVARKTEAKEPWELE